MTLALQYFQSYGIEIDEPVQKRFIQRAEMRFTGANTDNTIDIGNYSGTFWTAVGSTEPGTTALKAIKDIQSRSQAFLSVKGLGISDRAQDATTSAVVATTLLSAASVGGGVQETYTVTGLLTTDTILSVTPEIASATGRPTIVTLTGTVPSGAATGNATVTGLVGTDTILSVVQSTKGANSLPLLGFGAAGSGVLPFVYSADPGANGVLLVTVQRAATTDTYVPVSWNTQATNSLKVVYGADPGAGAKVLVAVARASTAVVTGTYRLTMDGTNTRLPDITYLSTDAPTSYDLVLEWEMPNNQWPSQVLKSA